MVQSSTKSNDDLIFLWHPKTNQIPPLSTSEALKNSQTDKKWKSYGSQNKGGGGGGVGK